MKNHLFTVLLAIFLLSVTEACSDRTIPNVYNYSITALANGNFIIFYYQYSSPNLSYALFNENGTSLKNGTLKTFSNATNQSTVASAGFPDGRIAICYKENDTVEPNFEFRDQDLNLVSGPYKPTTNKANRCHRVIMLGYINYAMIYVNDDYKHFDYFMSDTGLKLSAPKLTSKTSQLAVKSNKTSIYFILENSYFQRFSALLFDKINIEGLYYSMPVTRFRDFHISEKSNEIIVTYIRTTELYGYVRLISEAPPLTLNYRRGFLHDIISYNHASSFNQNGNMLMCIGYQIYICYIFKNSTTLMELTDIFMLSGINEEATITSLPSGRYVFTGWARTDKAVHLVMFGADGYCDTTVLKKNTSCPKPNSKCLNLGELSFFLGCDNEYFSFNQTCLVTCPPETKPDSINGKCVGIPKGFYESTSLKLLLACSPSCLICMRYGYMYWTTTDDLCAVTINDPYLPIYTFWINDANRGGMNLRANGQYIIPFLNLKSVIMKLEIAMLSADTGELSVVSLDSAMCDNQPIGSSYVSLSDGLFAVLVDCFIEQKILVFDSALNKICSFTANFDAETSQNPKFINVNDSFAFLGKKNNNLVVNFFRVDEKYNCYTSRSDTILPTSPNKNITATSFVYLTKFNEIAIVWTEFDVITLKYQVLMISMDVKGATSFPYTYVNPIDSNPINSTKIIEAINIGFIVIWTTRDLSTSFYSIEKQEFDYRRNFISTSIVESNLPSDPSVPSIVALTGGNHVIGWIQCLSSNLTDPCGISFKVYAIGNFLPLYTYWNNASALPERYTALDMLSLPDGGFVVNWIAKNGMSYIGRGQFDIKILNTFGLRFDSNFQEIRKIASYKPNVTICTTANCTLEFFISPYINSSNCSQQTLSVCDSFTNLISNIQGRAATIYFLKNNNAPHYIFTKEVDSQNTARYETNNYLIMGNMTLKPLFCDDPVLTRAPQLRPNCSEKGEIVSIYFKSPIIFKANNLIIQNIRLDGSENIAWMNPNLFSSFNSSNCLFRRVSCCPSSSPNIKCSSYSDLSTIPMTAHSSPYFDVVSNLRIESSILENFNYPSIDSLFSMASVNASARIFNSTFSSNKFRRGTFLIVNCSSMQVEDVKFFNYNPWNLKNSSSIEKNQNQGYFLLAENISLLEIKNSNFSDSKFENPGCGVTNNFYLRNFSLSNSVRSSDMMTRFLSAPNETYSLIYLGQVRDLSLSNNKFENIIGMVGSVLYAKNITGNVSILGNTFDSNFASRAFSNIVIKKDNNNTATLTYQRNKVINSLGCLDAFGNNLFIGLDLLTMSDNQFMNNYLPLSNSIATWNVSKAVLSSNFFLENGGILYDFWLSKFETTYFADYFQNSSMSYNYSMAQSSCIYIQRVLMLEMYDNTFTDNFGPNQNSQFLANSMSVVYLLDNGSIAMSNNTFDHNFLNLAPYRNLILAKGSNPQISIILDKYILTANIVITGSKFESSVFENSDLAKFNSDYNIGFLSILSHEAALEAEDQSLSYPDFKLANISLELILKDAIFKDLNCLNCSMFLLRLDLISHLKLTNCTFENINGLLLMNSIAPLYQSESLEISHSVFRFISSYEGNKDSFIHFRSTAVRFEDLIMSEIKFNHNNFVKINSISLLMSNIDFENITLPSDFIVSIYTLNVSLINITSNRCTCLAASKWFSDTFYLSNFRIENFLGGERIGLLYVLAYETKLTNLNISHNYYLSSYTLITVISNKIYLQGSTFLIASQKKVLSFLELDAENLYIIQNQFKSWENPSDIILFDISVGFSLLMMQNIFFEPYKIFTGNTRTADFDFYGNKVFTFLRGPIMIFDSLNQFRSTIADNIFIPSSRTNTILSECLITINDQLNSTMIKNNVFIGLETSLAVIEVISISVFYSFESQRNIFFNNIGTPLYLSASNRLSILSSGSESYALIQYDIYFKNHAKTSDQNRGYGGAIYINSKDKVSQKTHLNGNYFVSNKADLRGGAIYSDWNLPTFSNQEGKFVSNYAQRLNNIYTYPVHLTELGSNSSTNVVPYNVSAFQQSAEFYVWESIAPGIEFKEAYIYVLLDHYRQVCYDDDFSILTINPEGYSSMNISKFTSRVSVKASEGIYSISALKLTYPVGLNKTVYLNSSAVDTKLNYFVKILIQFRNCEAGEYIIKEKQICEECSMGYYLPFLDYNSEGPCLQCDQKKMSCLGGSNFGVLPGYWTLNSSSNVVLKCPITSACLGFLFGSAKGSLDQVSNCSEQYQGNLCSNCAPGYGKTSGSSVCSSCSDNYWYYIKIGVGITVSIAFFVYGIKQAIQDSFSKKKKFDKEMSIRVRIFLNFLQTISLLGNFSLNWSSGFTNIFSLFSQLGNIMQSAMNVDCFINTKQRDLSVQILKFIFTQISVFFYIGIGILYWIVYGKIFASASKSDINKKMIVTSIIILYNLLPQLIMSCLSMFKCQNLYREDLHLKFWVLDYDLKCYKGDHLSYGVGFNTLFIIIWIFAIPIWTYRKLYQNRALHRVKAFEQKFSFLYEGYRPEVFYWEFYQLGKKLIYILVVTFVSSYSEFLQFYICLLLTLIFYGIHQVKRPYENEKFNLMEKFSMVSCLCWTLVAVLISKNPDETYQYNLGESALIAFGLMGTTLFFFFWIWKYVKEFYRRRTILRRKSRMKIAKINVKFTL